MTHQTTFHGLPVKEAEASIYLRVTEADGGIPGDPFHCAWAEASHRMYDGMAAFFRTVAYIEIEPGVITRVAVPKEARKHIETFDKTGVMPSGTFVFKPVAPHRTLEARAADNRQRHDPTRPPHAKRKLNTGTGNGKPATVYAARGGYVPTQHK